MTAGRLWLLELALIGCIIACGGSDETLKPISTLESTPSVEPPPPTSRPVPTIQYADLTPSNPATSSSCPDPYAGGAPYQPTPGQPLRLRPIGSPPALSGFQPLPFAADAALDRAVRDSIGTEQEHFSVVVKRLDDGGGVSIDPGRLFYPASLFKVWVMLEAFHQRDAGLLDFDERFTVSSYYEQLRLNDGELAACSQISAGQALGAMISVSDNVAANMLYDRVGYSNVNGMLRQLGLGYSGLFTGGDLQTTASGMATLFEAIGSGRAISPGASQEMVALLEGSAIDDRIPALLPPDTPVAHKTGNWDSATHDVGIIYSPSATYVMAILTDYGPLDGGAARIARLSRAVYDYYNPVD